MEKYAWRAILKPDMKNEYKRRHDEIWPEMVEVLKKAGIKNYTIWLTDDELFGYYECEFGIEYAAKVQNESSTVKKWDEYMKDVMTMPKDEKTGAQPLMENVFSME